MDLRDYPENVQKLILELIKRNVISNLTDKMFINYLHSQKFDEDYMREAV